MAKQKQVPFEDIQELEKLQIKMENLRNEIKAKTNDLFLKFDDSVHAHEIEEDENGNHWIKLELIDNRRRLTEKEIVFKAAAVSAIDFKLTRQKTKPKAV